MTHKEIFDLIDRFEHSSIRSLRLSAGGVQLEMSKDGTALPAGMPVPAAAVQPAAQADAERNDEAIPAPLAGVFYVASAPGAQPYVRVGDHVRQGDTVCLMEAMKMISEVPAPCDCIITSVCKENGELTGYGEPLFRYRPC